jgi:putative restriction endonuclease
MDYREFFTSLFLWLKERETWNGGIFDYQELVIGFPHQGRTVTLAGPAGIWIPKGFDVPVSLRTVIEGPYNDGFSDDGILNYRYRGDDPDHRDNRAMREAFRTQTPLVYFSAVKPGRYAAAYPVRIVNDYPDRLFVEAALDPAFIMGAQPGLFDSMMKATDGAVFNVRRCLTRAVKVRLHQAAFRELVLDAYGRTCTVCRLRHPELLDAAHIIPDAEESGEPVIPNGLSLCKIHHSAYDQNIIGISPDYALRVRGDVLDESDGPMLEWGLKKLEGQRIVLPKHRQDYPDRDRLAKRFEEFGRAG